LDIEQSGSKAGSEASLGIHKLVMNLSPSSSLRYGSRDQFMIELSFEDDPAPDQNTPDEKASWGSLKIWVNGFNLCTHYDSGELRDAIHWNWWSLINWLQANWDPLLHEQALPVKNAAEWAAAAMREINRPETFDGPQGWNEAAARAADDWFRRHCLWSCRDGGLVPNIVIRRFYENAEISWTSHSTPEAPAHFRFQLADGGFRLPVEQVATPLHQFLTHAADYIAAKSGTATARALRKEISALTSEKEFNSRLSWLAGFGTEQSAYVQRFREKLSEGMDLAVKSFESFFPKPQNGLVVSGHCQGALMFGAVAPDLQDEDRLTIARAMVGHQTPKKKARELWQLIDKMDLGSPSLNERPWQEGYELANAWMEACELDPTERLDLESHLGTLGVTRKETRLSSRNTSGVAIYLKDKAPLILLNENCTRHADSDGNPMRSGIRFTLAHELCHLLIDRNSGSELALVSGPWAPKFVEKRANAFAAALLMPDEMINSAYDRFGSHPSSGNYDNLIQVAKEIDVSPDALSWHLRNRDFIDSAQFESLRAQFGNRA
jgi:Zn-dependent peptidase ImmA (M78 family)